MQYNLHPIFVHFPIALLTIYSLIKILPFKKWFTKTNWQDIEAVLLITGVFGLMAANVTGGVAEHMVVGERKLVEYHAGAASITEWLYGIIFAGVILKIFYSRIYSIFGEGKITLFIKRIIDILDKPIISNSLAFFALIAIFITGLLGGVLVYGTSADPLAPIVLRLLGLEI